jgi:hypothetical protein
VTAAAQATATGPAGAGARAASDAPRDWEAIRASSDIQFAPLPPMEPPQVPDWLAALGRYLQGLFGPVGEWLGVGWPTVEKGLIALAVLLVLVLLWALLAPVLRRLRRRAAEPQTTWAPDRDEALALLEDADALAAAGRFDEATHLLLRRSVGQIGEARSDWVRPASTARELGSLAALPAAARAAFAVIAARVERSRFALRPLTEAEWQTAREAYARFARIEIAG